MVVPFKDPVVRREWERATRENTRAKVEWRREYERERKNRKRVEGYMLLPEPERSAKLLANERRRSYRLRWKVVR